MKERIHKVVIRLTDEEYKNISALCEIVISRYDLHCSVDELLPFVFESIASDSYTFIPGIYSSFCASRGIPIPYTGSKRKKED